MKEGSLVAKHLNELQRVVNQLTSLKITFDGENEAL